MSHVALKNASPPGFPSILSLLRAEPLLWLIAAIIVTGALTSEYYLTGQNIENLLRSVSVFGLLALGMTVVMLTGRIDLSVAATMIFSIVVAVKVMVLLGDGLGLRWLVKGNTYAGPSLPFLAIAIVTGCAVGAVNGIGVAYFRIAPFIMTLVSLTALRGFNYVLTDGHPYYLRSPVFAFIGDQVVLGIPFSTLVFLAVLIALILFVNGTVAGSRFYAIGGSERAALYAGIRTDRYVVLAYIISGFCAALAGILFTARLKSVDAPLASGYELTAIAIAVIGGTALSGGIGSPWRTLLGSLVFASGLNLLAIWGIGTWYQNLIVGTVLIAAVALSRIGRPRASS